MHPSAKRLYEVAGEIDAEITTQADLARALHTTSQKIKNWEDRGVSKDGAIDAERKFGVSPIYILEGIITKPMRAKRQRVLDTVIFDRYDVSPSAGSGTHVSAEPSVIDTIEVLESWAFEKLGTNNPDKIKIVTNKGVSMAPTIRDGDILFVDVTVRHFDGDGIYVIDWSGRLLTKRLIAKLDNRIAIISDNRSPEYETEYIDVSNQDDLSICGKVKAYFSLREVI